MIRRYRTVVVGSYVGGVYRPIRYIRIPYDLPYPLGQARNVAAGAGDVIVDGGAVTVVAERTISVGGGDVIVQGGAVTVLDENSIAPSPADVVVDGGSVRVVATGGPEIVRDTGGSGAQFEWFERRNREDEIILQVIAEFLKQAA